MLRIGGTIFFVLLAAILCYFEVAAPLDLKLLDTQFKLIRAVSQKSVQTDVVVVGIDEETTGVLREPMTLWHAHLGKFLQATSIGGAGVIGLDVVLPDRSYDVIMPGGDRSLLAGVLTARRNSALVLARTVEPSGITREIYPPFVTAAGDDSLGYALLPVDYDSAIRRFDERIEWRGNAVPTLVGQMARRLGRPVEAGLIDYTAGQPFDFIPLQSVIAWFDGGNTAELEKAFRGKPVILGSVLKYEDRYPAPVNLVGWDEHAPDAPGVLLHAQALRSLLNDGLIQPIDHWMALLIGVCAGLLWLWAPAVTVAFPTLGLAILAGLSISTVALSKGHHLPVANAIVVAVLALTSRQILATALHLRERRRLRRAFGGYVSPTVLHDILSGKLKPLLGGERRFTCVLFSDIRGYTSRSEHASPEETIAFLNRYFQRVVPIIHAHGGTLVSFMGDGIMAVFGAPNSLPNPCAAAFDAAREMLGDCQNLNFELVKSDQSPLQIGIGLHAGDGLAGHIGAESRHEYSVIGDVTNVASRLEGLTKDVGYRLVCSRAVMDRISDRSALAPLGRHAVKGHSPVEVFGYESSSQVNVLADKHGTQRSARD